MKKTVILITIILWGCNVFPQTYAKYWVQFTDKNSSPYSIAKPEEFLSPRAIEKRNRFNIKITETDLPVNEHYISEILTLDTSVVLFTKSKWLNGITIYATCDSLINKLQKLPFVKFAERTISMKEPETGYKSLFEQSFGYNFAPPSTAIEELDYGKSKAQIFINNAQWLHRLGFRGEGMLLMVLDGGFHNVDSVRHFRKLRNEGRLWGVRNYVQPAINPMRGDAYHGTSVLSCIASNIPGELIGTAPNISVYLAQSEDSRSENKVEEDNWVTAMEWADSLGCDVLNSSLGYTRFDDAEKSYTVADLNGQTSRASQAATIGAARGIIVCISAGNLGNDAWTYIGTPADANHVLTAGGIDVYGNRAPFSSYNYEHNERIKPDACTAAVDVWVTNPFSKTTTMDGTSFASPLLAGMVSCLWQAFPQKTAYEVMEAVRQSCSNASNPDNSLGYGIADMFKAYNLLLNTPNENSDISVAIPRFVLDKQTFHITLFSKEKCNIEVSLSQKSTGYTFHKVFKLKEGENILKIKDFSKIRTQLPFEFLTLNILTAKENFHYLLGVEL
jgi:hypothetical protein